MKKKLVKITIGVFIAGLLIVVSYLYYCLKMKSTNEHMKKTYYERIKNK